MSEEQTPKEKLDYALEQLERVRQGHPPTPKGIELIKQITQLKCLTKLNT